MTAATLSRLPLSAGGALAGSMARGGVWTLSRLIDFGYLGVAQFMRAPIAITLVVAAVGFSVLAGSNALFLQTGRHPAPLFFAPPKAAAAPRPVIPAMRPRVLTPAIDNETTGSLGAGSPGELIDNANVMALQKKLAALKLFDGTADGLFGRRTASAIKAFESKSGMRQTGKLTRQVLSAVLAAPLPADAPAPLATQPSVAAAQPAIAPLAPARPVVVAKPVQLASATPKAALPAPTPLGRPVPLAPIGAGTAPKAAPLVAAPVTPVAAAGPAAAAPETQSVPLAPAPTTVVAPPAVAPAAAMPPAATLSTAQANAAVEQVASIAPATDTPSTDVSDSNAMAMNSPPAATPVATVAVAPANDSSQTPAQRLAAQMGTMPPEATPAVTPATLDANANDDTASTDPVLITKIQRALASLGFLGAKIDGQPGEATAKAIRNFQTFYDYPVTGQASPQMLNLLVQHGGTY